MPTSSSRALPFRRLARWVAYARWGLVAGTTGTATTGCMARAAAQEHDLPRQTVSNSGPITLGSSPAEPVIQAHLSAYNRRDLAAFMATLAPDIRMYRFPDSLLYAGRDTLRVLYGRLFREATTLQATITHRFVQGRFVVDRGVASGLPGQPPITDLEIFEVRDGLITRIWFIDP